MILRLVFSKHILFFFLIAFFNVEVIREAVTLLLNILGVFIMNWTLRMIKVVWEVISLRRLFTLEITVSQLYMPLLIV